MGFSTRDYVYRYRLTLDVDTPEGVKSGSSVLEISTRETERGVFRKLKGEAVVVDLGARGVLFALLVGRAENGGLGSQIALTDLPGKAAIRSGKLKIDDPNFESYLANSRDRIELVTAEIPFLVRFKDINDPKSVEAVDPKDLAKSFGTGVKLKRAMIEMTTEPVTVGVEKRLTWLQTGYPELRLVSPTGRQHEVPRISRRWPDDEAGKSSSIKSSSRVLTAMIGSTGSRNN